jgi:hypothetical protein
VILTARERNFEEFKSGGLHEKHAIATWNLETISAFAYKTEENQEILCRDGLILRVPLYSLGADRTENSASFDGRCLSNRCIATVAVLTAASLLVRCLLPSNEQ